MQSPLVNRVLSILDALNLAADAAQLADQVFLAALDITDL